MRLGTPRRSWRRTLATGLTLPLLVATILLGGVVVEKPTPAIAAACSGMNCTGKDPDGRCSATWTEQEAVWSSPAYWVQLRYSSGCNAFWARGQRDCHSPVPWAYVFVQRQIYTPFGYLTTHIYISGRLPCSAPGWTVMVGNSSGDRHRACIALAYDARDPSLWPASWWDPCTRWVYSAS